MTRKSLLALCAFLVAISLHADDWTAVAPGVAYREFTSDHTDIYVVRIDLTNDAITVISTPTAYRGTTVADFAAKTKAIAAINGDYFDAKFVPRGLTITTCDQWAGASNNPLHESVLAISKARATIQAQSDFEATSDVATAVAGWPLLVRSCTPLTAKELPGSDVFTRSPQPRTAVGLTKDGATLYFVVADGRRTGIPGLTLADLGSFMADELDVCSAVNLDGGGSSTMWVSDKVVNRPADGVQRKVGDHLAVVFRSDLACPDVPPMTPAQPATSTQRPR